MEEIHNRITQLHTYTEPCPYSTTYNQNMYSYVQHAHTRTRTRTRTHTHTHLDRERWINIIAVNFSFRSG